MDKTIPSEPIRSIRSFIGAYDFDTSRQFYHDLGFAEISISHDKSYYQIAKHIGFYLQNYYNEDWVNNSMLFLEVEHLDDYWKRINKLQLTIKYDLVSLSEIVLRDWGREFFLHDPSGVLWHIGSFNNT